MALFSSSRPGIRVRVLTRFPSRVLATSGLSVTKSNGVYTFANAYDTVAALPSIEVAEHDNTFVLVYNSDDGTYRRLSIEALVDEITGGTGGLGDLDIAQGDILYGSAADTLALLVKSTTATRYLSNTGASNNPAWAQVNLANGVTGNLPVTNLASGTSASASTFWRGDGTWNAPAPAASTPAEFGGMQVNGSCVISQELGTTGTSTSGGYPVDNWILTQGGASVVTAAQVLTGPPGIPSHIAITVGTADASIAATDLVGLYTPIEGYRFAKVGWGASTAQPIAIGFWTAHHRTGVYGGSFRNSATNRSYTFEYTQSVADTWQLNVLTIAGDQSGTWLTTTGAGLYISFAMMAGANFVGATGSWSASNLHSGSNQINGVAATSDVFRITGLTVLPGTDLPSSTQSPLLSRPFAHELDLCQRYYWRPIHSGTGSYIHMATFQCYGTTAALGNIWLPRPMRAAPTTAVSSAAHFCLMNSSATDISLTTFSAVGASTENVYAQVAVASGLVAGNATGFGPHHASATISFSSRL